MPGLRRGVGDGPADLPLGVVAQRDQPLDDAAPRASPGSVAWTQAAAAATPSSARAQSSEPSAAIMASSSASAIGFALALSCSAPRSGSRAGRELLAFFATLIAARFIAFTSLAHFPTCFRFGSRSFPCSFPRPAPRSLRRSVAIAALALEERLAPAFEDRLDIVLALIDGTDAPHAGIVPIGLEDKHPLGLSQHRDIRIVGDEDDLSGAAHGPERLYDCLVDECVVKVVLRLVDEERALALHEQDRQDRRAALPGGQVR